MGASPTQWSYFVPYEEDVSEALRKLRQDVFARGDYICGLGDADYQVVDWQAMANAARELAESPGITGEARQQQLAAVERCLNLHEKQSNRLNTSAEFAPYESIEELLEAEEYGTHSILDITSISSRAKRGAISPIPSAELLDYFDTDKPTHEVIVDRYEWGSLDKFTTRAGRGIYIVVYRDDKPDEIFFAGSSGY